MQLDHDPAHHLTRLKTLADDGACVIVEGKNDESTLRKLGVEATFYHVSGSGRSILALAETASKHDEVVILTDFDEKGSELASRLVEFLQTAPQRTRINLNVRRGFMDCMKTQKVGEVQDITNLFN